MAGSALAFHAVPSTSGRRRYDHALISSTAAIAACHATSWKTPAARARASAAATAQSSATASGGASSSVVGR